MIPQLYLLAVPMMAASLAEAHGPHMEKRHWPIPFFPDPFAHKESAPAPVYSTFTSYDNAQGASTATQYANAKGPATVTQYAQVPASTGTSNFPSIQPMAQPVHGPDRDALGVLLGGDDDVWLNWAPAGPGEMRGPCPMLNALANHGVLPRSGKDINMIQFYAGLLKLGVGTLIASWGGGLGIALTQPAGTTTLDLHKLGAHGVLEHDASFSRPDATMGDFMKFNQTVWDRTMSFNKPGATTWTTRSMLDAHYARLQDAKKDSPDTVYGPRQALFEYLEMSVTSQLLGDWWFGNPRLDWVEILFKEERLPYKEGWRAHPIVVDWEGVWAQMLAMAAMSPNPIEEVGYLTTSTMSSLVKGTQFGPILACVMGLPGCDGSSKKLI